MRRALLALPVLFAVLLGATSPASAKGPTEAVITGPGIDEPIDLRADLHDATFWSVTEDLGYFAVVGPGFSPRPSLARPTGELGPRYELAWQVMTGPATSTLDVTLVLYPWAEGGGRIFVPAGQEPMMGGVTEATWYDLPTSVLPLLETVGFPDRATAFAAVEPPAVGPPAHLVASTGGTDGVSWLVPLAALLALVGGGAWLLVHRRRLTVVSA